MGTADSGAAASAAAARHVSLIDELLARPFPHASHWDHTGSAGPGHHLRVLRAGQGFSEDDDGAASRDAAAELQIHLDALTARLTARWGEPLTVDLWPYLRAGVEGEAVPEPIDSLCQVCGGVRVWPLPETGRWVALAVGQEDKELPLELLAAVGETAAFDAAAAGRP